MRSIPCSMIDDSQFIDRGGERDDDISERLLLLASEEVKGYPRKPETGQRAAAGESRDSRMMKQLPRSLSQINLPVAMPESSERACWKAEPLLTVMTDGFTMM